MTKKIDSAKRWLGLLTAIIFAIVLFTMCSCNSTKKVISKDAHSKDSTATEKSNVNTTATAEIKADVTTQEATTTDNTFEVVTIDSGFTVQVPATDTKDYFEVITKKPTKFILPKKTEKKIIVTEDHSTTQKKEVAAKVEEKKIEVVSQDVVIKKDIKKTRVPVMLWLIPLIIGIAWYANKKFKIIDKIKAFV